MASPGSSMTATVAMATATTIAAVVRRAMARIAVRIATVSPATRMATDMTIATVTAIISPGTGTIFAAATRCRTNIAARTIG